MSTKTPLDHQESTLVWDYYQKTVELYTTKRSTWLRTIARNTNFIPGSAVDLQPGYSILYPLDQCRLPFSLVRPSHSSDSHLILNSFLTPAELHNRSNALNNLQKN